MSLYFARLNKIFETINERGVGLDAMDLLKNLLFMKASRADFKRLKVHWKELQDALFDMNEKPLRFLRYFIFSRYDVDILREDEIYGWFAKNEDQCGYDVDPSNFAKELLRAAKTYGQIPSRLRIRAAPRIAISKTSSYSVAGRPAST